MSARRGKAAQSAEAALVKSRVTRYFNECRKKDMPATPAGLALALDVSTEEHTGGHRPEALRRPVERALQLIERETLERALSGRGGSKGVEFVLQQTAQARGGPDELEALSDEELNRRLADAARAIEEALKA